jgi:very-short-patch-repair endonuclease
VSRAKRPYTKPDKANACDALEWQIRHMASWLPAANREWNFHEKRKWALDFAWPVFKIAVEVDGGIWRNEGGAHTGTGHIRDIRKGNDAIEAGWRVLHFIPEDIVDDGGRSNTIAIDKIVAVFEKLHSIRKEDGHARSNRTVQSAG